MLRPRMTSSETASTSTEAYCADLVRTGDRDRFLCALTAPMRNRRALLALLAFNHEVARTREVVREPVLGSIRLQWWRESLDEARQGRPRAHPVVEELAAVAGMLPYDRLARLIDARERDLDDSPFADLEALEAYVGATAGELARASLDVLGEGDGVAADAARQVGLAWGLVGLIRAVPFHASRRRFYLPQDRLLSAGVSQEAMVAGRPEPGLASVLKEIATRAEQHIATARDMRPRVPRTALPALLPARLADRYLARLRRAGFDIYAAVPDPAPVAQPLQVGWGWLTGRY
jgi:NADH dehydrogenase [ubiquinone] 1 alpha subcomplex assembly factor 6